MSTPTERPPGDTGPGRRFRSITGMDLLSAAEFERVSDTVRGNNPGMEPMLSRRITAEALAYLTAVAADREAQIAPSPVVDEGWHALVLHTELYARLCDGLGGGFIHHYPQRTEENGYALGTVERTIAAMSALGYEADPELWAGPEDGGVQVAANVWHSPGPNCGPIIVNPPGVPKPKRQAPQPA
ncbi:glycine-rich domain-containing protein [Kitasatospora cineracea]|uniref:glycine-rich domain-containing protein n=1 Tax=Kitasatospora cineracea TaxID=88074 RepID=UPI00378F9E6F